MSSGHRDYDYLEWIARLTSHNPDRGTRLVHYYGACSNAHRGVARRRESFVDVPPEDEPFDFPRPESTWLAVRRKTEMLRARQKTTIRGTCPPWPRRAKKEISCDISLQRF